MSFEVRPVLEAMLALYQKPRDRARFDAYLHLLNGGTKADLAVPVMHFNPMAKDALVARLRELLEIDAEKIAAEALQQLNAETEAPPDEPRFQVVLNLADDLHGGWTNRYTTDFANTFDLGALLKRGFCTPILWASEAYTPALIRQRTQAQAWRTRYCAQHARPHTVAEYLAQEHFVARHVPEEVSVAPEARCALRARYVTVQHATDVATLLTFFYGDVAAEQLGHPVWGNWPANAGFLLAQFGVE
jgi:hypothetical protein